MRARRVVFVLAVLAVAALAVAAQAATATRSGALMAALFPGDAWAALCL